MRTIYNGQISKMLHLCDSSWPAHSFTPGVNFINVLCTAFALVDPESVKNTVKSSVSFYAFGIYKRKSCT
jgi:hypothetical protein